MSYHALVPAAGSGSRMGGATPKQYLPLAGKPLIWHALFTLCAVPAISRVVVVLSPEDDWWPEETMAALGAKLVVLRCGGATRAASVTNGLHAMRDLPGVADDDWVLVHDAARPCLTVAHVTKLIAEAGDDAVGGILAVPVADTLKRAMSPVAATPDSSPLSPSGRGAGGEGECADQPTNAPSLQPSPARGEGVCPTRIAATVPREGLWQAQTPQMFRHRQLLDALTHAPAVTDEASAIEACGLHPRLVEADAGNFKVTYPRDLEMAALVLQQRGHP